MIIIKGMKVIVKRPKTSNKGFLLGTLLIVTLAGCGGSSGVRDALGIKTKAPDEFMVISRPSLTVPPSFALDKPDSGDTVQRIKSVISKEARESLIGKDMATKSPASGSELSLLSKAGTVTADGDIREIINKEYNESLVEKIEKDESFLSSLNPFTSDSESVLDADAEKERLRNNKKEDKSILEGESEALPKNQGIF